MGLNDIEKKIIGDAEAEAARLVTEAKSIQDKRINEAKNIIAQERKKQQELAKNTVVRMLEQRKQLYRLTADQEILKTKRELLAGIIAEVQESILNNEDKLEKYFSLTLKEVFGSGEKITNVEIAAENKDVLKKALKNFPEAINIETIKGSPDYFVIIFEKSRINCSLGLAVREKAKAWESELVQVLLQG